jgi:protein-S-isoprenylcysteine O-methyltransferase Ste14
MGRIAWLVAIACWGAFWYVYWFRAHRPRGRVPAATDRRAMWGLALETAAIFLAWFRVPVDVGAGRMAASMILAPAGVALFAWAVEHLGRQFRIQAGLWPDHRLVRTGPYALVRHPIYLSLFLLMLATALLSTTWWLMLLAAGLYAAGTEIRIRIEDKLLHSRFGAEFEDYRRRVPAWLPPVR